MNINSIQSTLEMLKVRPAAVVAAAPQGATAAATADTASLSTRGKLLGALPPLTLPARDSLQKFASQLGLELRSALSDAGIAAEPAVEFDSDPATGAISVKGDSADTRQIEAVLKDNPALERQVRNVLAIGSQVHAIEAAEKVDAQYRQAQTPQAIQTVLAQYGAQFAGRAPAAQISLLVDGQNAQLNADGARWA